MTAPSPASFCPSTLSSETSSGRKCCSERLKTLVEILSVTASETSPGGSCSGNCLMTADTTPLEPDVDEHKVYAPGIGLIVEIDVETGNRVEFVEFTPGT